MADQVQFHLEKMVPELEDLQERGIFLPNEIRSIVKQRTTHEYRIHRIIPLKADFLRYIAYEENLERLRRKRKARLGMDHAPTPEELAEGVKHSSLSDYSMMRRIHGLYNKLLMKFAGDTALWIQYFDWCRTTKSTKALGRVFAKALQMHPTNDTFWIMAAAWEFEDNGNIAGARVLMQRGLRLNAESRKLWVEYFKLELLWVEKIKERRRVLFRTDGQVPDATPVAAHQPAENGIDLPELEGEMDLPPTLAENDEMLASSAQPAEKSSDTAAMMTASLSPTQVALLKVLIPRAIYRNAIQAHPRDLFFRLQFLDVYRLFQDTEDGQNELLDSLIRDFGTDPVARGVLAQRGLAAVSIDNPTYPAALRQAVALFQEAVKELNVPAAHEVFATFLAARSNECNEENLKLYLSHLLIKSFTEAHESDNGTERLYLDWAAHVGSTSPKSAVAVLQRATSAIPVSATLWLALARAEDPLAVAAIYERAVKSVETPEALAQVWAAYVSHATSAVSLSSSTEPSTATPLDQLFKRALNALPDQDLAVPVLQAYLTYAARTGGIECLRANAGRLAKQRTRPKAFWKTWVQLEMRYLEEQDQGKDRKKRSREGQVPKDASLVTAVRRVWDGLVAVDETDMESWLDYIRFELDIANANERATALHWRADKAVADKDEFARRYQVLVSAL
ncbi:U3 snoRNP protein [Thoreauomyces humboldtii]|nr:U3 snoRNP protein [Thoreauomyces humboldtii]